MKFRYKQYGSGIVRPVIPVVLSHKQLSIPYEALIDSGADFCLFDAQLGQILQLDITKGERRFITGVTGATEVCYFHPINLKVGDHAYRAETGFMPGLARMSYGIVGQVGFFDKFVVKFDYSKEEIELKERKP